MWLAVGSSSYAITQQLTRKTHIAYLEGGSRLGSKHTWVNLGDPQDFADSEWTGVAGCRVGKLSAVLC